MDSWWKFSYSKKWISKSWYANSRVLAFGGFTTAVKLLNTEEYNGTSWTAGGNINTARSCIKQVAGTQTSSFSFWWLYFWKVVTIEQQKNIMAHLGLQLVEI
jgi:hypothetical protein